MKTSMNARPAAANERAAAIDAGRRRAALARALDAAPALATIATDAARAAYDARRADGATIDHARAYARAAYINTASALARDTAALNTARYARERRAALTDDIARALAYRLNTDADAVADSIAAPDIAARERDAAALALARAERAAALVKDAAALDAARAALANGIMPADADALTPALDAIRADAERVHRAADARRMISARPAIDADAAARAALNARPAYERAERAAIDADAIRADAHRAIFAAAMDAADGLTSDADADAMMKAAAHRAFAADADAAAERLKAAALKADAERAIMNAARTDATPPRLPSGVDYSPERLNAPHAAAMDAPALQDADERDAARADYHAMLSDAYVSAMNGCDAAALYIAGRVAASTMNTIIRKAGGKSTAGNNERAAAVGRHMAFLFHVKGAITRADTAYRFSMMPAISDGDGADVISAAAVGLQSALDAGIMPANEGIRAAYRAAAQWVYRQRKQWNKAYQVTSAPDADGLPRRLPAAAMDAGIMDIMDAAAYVAGVQAIGLKERPERILRMLSRGMKQSDIAAAIGISQPAVARHIAAIRAAADERRADILRAMRGD